VTSQSGVSQVLPLTLHLGSNRVKEPARLLKNIQEKGGKQKVQFRPSPEPYDHVGKEFLSICMPGFLEQSVSERKHAHKSNRSRSGHGHPRVRLKPAPKPAEKVEKVKKSRRAAPAATQNEEPEHWRPAVSSPHRSRSADAKKKRASSRQGEKANKSRRKDTGDPQAAATSPAHSRSRSQDSASPARSMEPAAEGPPTTSGLALTADEQQTLQQEVGEKLITFGGLPSEEATREMLSEFVVCMAVAGKGSKEILSELKAFLDEEAAATFVKWFRSRVERWKKK